MYQDIRGFISKVDEEGELVRIRERLSPRYEIPGAIKYLTRKKNVAVLIEHVDGFTIPVVANLLGTKKRLATALGVEEADLIPSYLDRREKPVRPVIVADGPVKEVEIVKNVDIARTMPVLTHHEKDAGPYFTSAVTIARDPETGIRGMGIHRIQVRDQKTVALFLATPPLSLFLAKAEARGIPLEIAILIGLDPLTFFSSVCWAPEGTDKFDIAGGLSGRPIELVKCSTIDLEIPALAEFALEGKVVPGERQPEGPFGESTGYYFMSRNPVAEITAITHRKDPIYQALVPFCGNEEMVLLDVGWEMGHLRELQNLFPFVRKVHFSNTLLTAVAQIEKTSDEDSVKLIGSLLANPFIKIAIIVDSDVDPHDAEEVNWAIATRVQPERDVVVKGGMDGLVIDPSTWDPEVSTDFYSSVITRTSKLGVDATKPLNDIERYRKIDIPEAVKNKILPLVARYL
jgi:2,5-furandicarboxylate decarboxylase 1